MVRCRLDGRGAIVSAHLPDPGRLTDLLVPGRRLWLRRVVAPRRKLRWSAVLVETPRGSGLVSVDTTMPNRLIARALELGALEELSGWKLIRREWRWRDSRFDFLLRDREGSRKLVLEVKSVTLVQNGVGLFPDAVTARGARHVSELALLARRRNWHGAIMFVVQRGDAERVTAAAEIDPDFAAALERAKRAGVRVLGRRCRVTRSRVELGGPIAAG
ncbi:Sugar fermentation stimulation protein A [bacterium HR33]|nr:Sugar fermentation stimulation protein A [bacterium HR33]